MPNNINFRKRNIPSDVIIGGPSDIHTTRSKIYTRVANNDGIKITRPSSNRTQLSTANNIVTDEANNRIQNNTVNYQEMTDTTSEPVRDYNTLPDLQGPPRVGDKLAFKVCS